jgi:hypothetical protein
VKRKLNFIIMWAVLLFIGLTLFNFLHECGHGFGAKLDGTHISTGFNKVGDIYKKPSDSDFRTGVMESGILNSSGLLGPFINWIMAILFTVLLYRRNKANLSTLMIGVIAVSNALNRLAALIPFFIGALHNNLHLADEIEWGLKTIKQLNFPMSMDKIMSISDNNPSLILSDPWIYFWPAVSIIISLVCFYLAYRLLYKLFKEQLNSKLICWVFGLMPVLVGAAMIVPVAILDNVIRINW